MIDNQTYPDQRFPAVTDKRLPVRFAPAVAFWGLLAVNMTIMVVGLPVIIASQIRKRLFT